MTQRRFIPLWLTALAALLLWVYFHSFTAPFIFDDHNAVIDNAHIRSLATAHRAPDQSTVAGRPVVSYTLALNYALGGLDVRGYHVVNFLLHVACAVTLLVILRRIAGVTIAVAAVSLWAVHPLCTEAVVYTVQRTELLAVLFMLLTFAAAMRWLDKPHPRTLIAAACASALAMASKEIAFAAPILVLLYDRVAVSGSFTRAWREHRTLHLSLAATWLVLIACMLTGPRSDTVGFGHGIAWHEYLRTQAGIIGMYIRQSFGLAPLSITHDVPLSHAWTDNLAQSIALAALFIATFVGCCIKRWRLALAGAAFFLILAPTSSVVPIASEFAAERRMYLPLAAIVVLVCAALSKLPKPLFTVAVCFFFLMGAQATRQRVADYRSEVSIWAAAVAVYPHDMQAISSLGMAQVKAGDVRTGVNTLHRALGVDPNDLEAHANLAAAYLLLNENARAMQHALAAIQLQPQRVAAHVNLGIALARLNRLDDAETAFRNALKLQPDRPEANYHLAKALLLRDDYDGAIACLERTLRMQPDHADAQRLMALAQRLWNEAK